MKHFRRLYRIIGILFWFIIMTFYAIFFHFIYRLQGRPRHELVKRLSFAARVWGKGLGRILGLRINVIGDINFVHGIIVSNHLGYIDILVLSSVFPIRFAPKKEIAKWPFLGWFIRISAPIWVDRTSKQASIRLMEEFSDTVKNGTCLIVFPEGTTTDGKSDLLPFKSAVFEAAIKENIMLNPVLLHYNEGKHSVCWYDDEALLSHAWKVFGMKKIEADMYIMKPVSPENKHRKKLAVEIHNTMNEKYKEYFIK